MARWSARGVETALQVIADAGFAPPVDGLVLQLVNGYVRGAAVPVAEPAPDPAVIERSDARRSCRGCSRC